MLLRASGEVAGLDVDFDVVMSAGTDGDPGVPAGRELLAFATAANLGSDGLAAAAEALEAVVGAEGVLEAANTVAAFNGLVRVADGTGIQLDPTMLTSTAAARDELGISDFAGAANSVDAPTERRKTSDPSGALSLFD